VTWCLGGLIVTLGSGGKFTDEKCEPTEDQRTQNYLVDGGGRQDSRLAAGIRFAVNISQQFILTIQGYMTGKTGLIVDGFLITVRSHALMTSQTIRSVIPLAEILFAVRGNL